MKFVDENGGNAASLSDALDRMWKKFLPEIRARARVLEDAARAAAAGNLPGPEREAAQAAAHKLAGTLGIFGLARGTELARELEKVYAGHADSVSADRLAEMAAELGSMIERRK